MIGLLRDRQGSVITLGALLFPVLLGLGALAVDCANLYYNKSKVQMAADAASLGAASALPDTAAATSRALDLVGLNTPASFGTLSKAQDVKVGIWDASAKTFTPNSTSPNAVQVSTHRTAANGNPVFTFFGRLAGTTQLEVNGQAIAVKYGGTCVRVLDRTAAGAFSQSGSGSSTLNCSLQVDSSSPTAARTQGTPTVTSTKQLCVTGGYSGSGWSPVPTTGCRVLGDPLASIPEPAAPSTPCAAPVGNAMASNCTLTGSVSFGGTISLQSGLYYLRSANVTITSASTLTGSDVMIFVDASSTLTIGGGGTVSLSAAASGTYAGILIFQSRATPASTTVSINAGGSLSLNGTLYAPSSTLSLGANGSYSSTAQFGYLIADKVIIGGSSNFIFNAFSTTGVTPRTLKPHAGLVG